MGHSAPSRWNGSYFILREALEFRSQYPLSLTISTGHETRFGWNGYSGRRKMLSEAYPPLKCIFFRKMSDLVKPTLLRITCLLNSGRVKRNYSSGDIVVFMLVDFLEWGEYLHFHNDEITHIRSALFWSVGMDFWILLVREWTTWTGVRKRGNFVREFPSRNVYFVSVFQITICHSFINRINESPNLGVQHFLLLRKMIISPVLLCD